VTDATKLLEHALVLPSGQPWVQELSNLNRVRYPFAGGYYDSAKAIYGMGDRWYDPRYGLFYSSDPILLDDLTETIEQPLLANAYLYADGNPTSLTDETGNDAESPQLNNVAAPLPPANGQNRSSKGVIDTLFPKITDDEQDAMDSKAKALGFIANPMKVNVNLSDMDLEIGGFGVRASIKAVAQKVGLAVFKAFW
jgi:RHS repeat-associated protein